LEVVEKELDQATNESDVDERDRGELELLAELPGLGGGNEEAAGREERDQDSGEYQRMRLPRARGPLRILTPGAGGVNAEGAVKTRCYDRSSIAKD
jgi:hypothetical protein